MWRKVEDELPELEQPVWMICDDRILMGCRSNYDSEGWLWCRLYDMPHFGEQYRKRYGWPWGCEPYSDDDYKPTHWKSLPELPTIQLKGTWDES